MFYVEKQHKQGCHFAKDNFGSKNIHVPKGLDLSWQLEKEIKATGDDQLISVSKHAGCF